MGFGCAMTGENKFIAMSDFDSGGIEQYSAAGITKLSNGDE